MLKRDILFVPGGDFSVRDIDAVIHSLCNIGVSTDIFLFLSVFICVLFFTFFLFFSFLFVYHVYDFHNNNVPA